MSSSWTERRRRRAFRRLAEARPQVERAGRTATAAPLAPGSFYTAPHDGPALASFDGGVAPALRQHLGHQGLTDLAGAVDELAAIGRAMADRDTTDDTVGDLVYEMH